MQKKQRKKKQKGGTYYIPEGFKLAEDSATQISEGIVIEDRNENQWVWVPCHVEGGANQIGTVLYDRYAFARSNLELTQTKLTTKDSDGSFKIILDKYSSNYYHEGLSQSSIEYKSIKRYGGYFIGRYEAGYENGKTIVQKDKVPTTNISYANCIARINELVSSDGSNNKLDGREVVAKLCSSYAWDTALMFIQKTHTTYATTCNTNQGILAGQYNNNLYGTGKINTGKTLPVCNIYDMGGNVYEFTTEICTSFGAASPRGGYWGHNITTKGFPGLRTTFSGNAEDAIGFRPTIYIIDK